METTNDSVLYHYGNDQVTSTQARINGTTYDLVDIAAASIIAPVLRREYGYVLAAVGLVLLIAGYLVWGIFLVPMLVGSVLLIAGIAIAMTVHDNFTILLKHHDAQLTKVQFPERVQAEQFMHALNQGINQAT